MRAGEQLRPDFTEGNGLGETFYAMMFQNRKIKMFGGNSGDRLVYERELENSYEDAVLTVRYTTYESDEPVCFSGNYGDFTFAAGKKPVTASFPLGKLDAGSFRLELTAQGTQSNGILFDCFCITERASLDQIHFKMHKRNVIPGYSTYVQYAFISTKNTSCSKNELEQIWKKRTGEASQDLMNPESRPYDFSAGLMKTALFSNVVYPIHRHGEEIVHYTPGKRWDSLYTWDSGFIGLGLLEYSPRHAEYVLDTYLSEEENTDFAFLAHGSLVPTQFYLWHEILMRASADRRKELKKYYPMLRRYYLFMAGRSEGSSMSRLSSGMLTVYDYFYNASGMDDYPPQVEMHRLHLSNRIAPVCSSAHFIRIAKIILQTAEYYGYDSDAEEYRSDIRKVSDALLSRSWDESCGYFSYVLHDPESGKTEIFRTSDGENFNRGIDGVTPLITGICSREQEQHMLAHLKSDQELWTSSGISTVDQSASYYRDNGYWNGAVWFPYQYLLWKSMLDIGENDFAFKIAETALYAWKLEADFSYNTFEMIQIETGRGGWFHQFGGLSSPIVIWYNAYFRRGTVTAGYDTWLEEPSFSDDFTAAEIGYCVCSRRDNMLIAVMDSGFEYTVEINGQPAEVTEHVKGALEIRLHPDQGKVVITRK